jgi:hypothetical protein
VGKEFERWLVGIPLKKIPACSPLEIRHGLIRLNEKWKKLTWKNDREKQLFLEYSFSCEDESKDDDDIFMPRTKGKSVACSQGKSAGPANINSDDDFIHSIKGSRVASSKGKSVASSKGKSVGLAKHRLRRRLRVPISKGKSVAPLKGKIKGM